ncbi:MAG TPA: RNA polymerase sigma factor [Bacteroidota bacterium]|nr:RNA polymerase sigma factor [Bacteroidota bacterium]
MALKTDFELIELFRHGDVTGFNELVRRYQEKVYWIARRTMGNHEDADDVVQDVFVRVFEKLKYFRGDANFYTWLYRVTVNVSLNALRKKRIKDILPFDELFEETLPADNQTDRAMYEQEYQTILEKAIDRLPAKQKAAFMMRYYDEMTYEDMAKILHTSVGGLKANYFHALKKIQEYVRKEMSQ